MTIGKGFGERNMADDYGADTGKSHPLGCVVICACAVLGSLYGLLFGLGPQLWSCLAASAALCSRGEPSSTTQNVLADLILGSVIYMGFIVVFGGVGVLTLRSWLRSRKSDNH